MSVRMVISLILLINLFAASAHAQLVDGYKGKYVMYHGYFGKPHYYFNYSINKIGEDSFEIACETLCLNPVTGDHLGKRFNTVVLSKECEIQSYAYELYDLNGEELGEKRFAIEIDFKKKGEKTQLVFRGGEREWTKEMPADWTPLFWNDFIGYIYAALRLKPEMVGREFELLTMDGAQTWRWRLLEVKNMTVDIGGRDYSGQAYIFEDITRHPNKNPFEHTSVLLFIRDGEFIAYLERSNFFPDNRCSVFIHIVEDFGTEVQFAFPEQFK